MSGLRRASSADIDHVARLERTCFGADDGIFSRRQLRALLANPCALWLISTDHRAMGCWLEAGNGQTRWARLYSLAVHPALRGQGWGGRLLEAGFVWMRERGLVVCRAEVKANNVAARALYARYGFTEKAFLPDYYGPGHHGLRLVHAGVPRATRHAALA
jgi:ribosomal-protein-alanine N-acetyltransferase